MACGCTPMRVSHACHNTDSSWERLFALDSLIEKKMKWPTGINPCHSRNHRYNCFYTPLTLRPWHFPTSRPKYNEELTANERSSVRRCCIFRPEIKFLRKVPVCAKIFVTCAPTRQKVSLHTPVVCSCLTRSGTGGSQHVASTCCPWRQRARGALGKSLLKFRSSVCVCVRTRDAEFHTRSFCAESNFIFTDARFFLHRDSCSTNISRGAKRTRTIHDKWWCPDFKGGNALNEGMMHF